MSKSNIIRRVAARLMRPVRHQWATRSNAAIFDRIYKDKRWGSAPDQPSPFYSGAGSYDPSTDEYATVVRRTIASNHISTVVEIGCGDFSVASKYVDACGLYTGVDVVRRLVDFNSKTFGNDRIKFIAMDASRSRVPPADLCIVRQVFQHLSNKDISKVLDNISSKFLLITEHLPSVEGTKTFNLDKVADAGIRVPLGSGVFIDKPPFNFPAEIIFETNVTSDIHAPDERLVTWLVKTPDR